MRYTFAEEGKKREREEGGLLGGGGGGNSVLRFGCAEIENLKKGRTRVERVI